MYDRILILATTTAVAARPAVRAAGLSGHAAAAAPNVTQLRPAPDASLSRHAAGSGRRSAGRSGDCRRRSRGPGRRARAPLPGVATGWSPLMPPARPGVSARTAARRDGRRRRIRGTRRPARRMPSLAPPPAPAVGTDRSRARVRRQRIGSSPVAMQDSTSAVDSITRTTMPEIDRYRPEDQRGVEALYRRVFGPDAAAASRLRWDWQYRRNPNNPERRAAALGGARRPDDHRPLRDDARAARRCGGNEIDAAWGTDAMVAPERQRRGLGEELFRTWDRSVGASLGLGLSDSSSRLLKKLHLPDVPPMPCLVKPLTRRAVRAAALADGAEPPRLGRDAADRARGGARAAAARRRRADPPVRRVVHGALGAARRSFELAVRRDAAYLNWKYIEPPHVRYSRRGAQARRPRRRVRGLSPRAGAARPRDAARRLSRRHARRDRLQDAAALGRRRGARRPGPTRSAATRRTWASGASCGTPGISRCGHRWRWRSRSTRSTVPPKFYKDTDDWHITLGDSDQDVGIRDWD